MSEEQHPGLEIRVTRVEANLKAVQSTLDTLLSKFDVLASKFGRPNYTMLSVMIAGIMLIGSVAAVAIFGPIQNNKERIESNTRDLHTLLDREIARNNKIEYQIGALQEFHDLYVAGLLNLREEKERRHVNRRVR